MSNDKKTLDKLKSKLKNSGFDIPLSKFVEQNLGAYKEFKIMSLPIKSQAQLTESVFGKKVSASSLAVAISRLSPPKKIKAYSGNLIVVEKSNKDRFTSKDAILTLGSQKIKTEVIKDGKRQIDEQLIAWRGLYPNEKISNWITEYREQLSIINLEGWRWTQIASAITRHLSLPKEITANTVTSIISISRKKDVKK